MSVKSENLILEDTCTKNGVVHEDNATLQMSYEIRLLKHVNND